MIKVSVIVPVYNAERYIGECIASLLGQAIISEMEIIVVDDHGEDGSIEVVKEIIKKHKCGARVKIISTKANEGAWSARNLGIFVANGKYIGFCDADDYVESDMYECLYDEAEKNESDWAYCCVSKDYGNGRCERLNPAIVSSCVMGEKEKRKMFVKGVAWFWSAIYRKEFLLSNRIKFPAGKFSEDSFFWWDVVMYANRLGVVPRVGYHYRIHPGSISRVEDMQKPVIVQNIFSMLISKFKKEKIYGKYRTELDYLYLKKGYLIPLMTYSINRGGDYEKFEKQRRIDDICVWSNKYLYMNPRILLLSIAFFFLPGVTAWLLKMRYKNCFL